MFPQLFGKYVLEREIAAGGMARVYLATLRGAVGFEKRLVVKQIRTELASDAAFVARFVEEAKTAVELSHPNIVPVYELGVEQGVYYIAMELCEGLTLSDLLAQTGPLGPTEGAYLGAEICRALDYAHRRAHIVHRDVTPRNVLIDEEGAVRLIDFGIAAPVTSVHDTARREIFGSPGHMPPEQLSGAALTPASDVFAVGALLIEAWTGEPPFRRATASESEQALHEVPELIGARIPELAPLNALIASTIARDAGDRPSAAERLARPLREFAKSEDSGDIARRLAERVQRARRRLQASPSSIPPAGGTPAVSAATRLVSPGPATSGEFVALGGDSRPVTRTFAAREDLRVWTRKLASIPAPEAPPPSAVQHAPTGSASFQRRTRWWVAPLAAVALVALGALGAVGAARDGGPPKGPPTPRVSSAKSASSETPASAPLARIATASAAPEPSLRAPLSPPPHARKVPLAVGPPRAVETAEAVPSALGELKITADPRAQVAVTGAGYQRREQSPLLGLKLAAGSYEIEFSNDTFGAPLSARVLVVAGGTVRVHADFRRAVPAIVIR